VDTLTTLDVTIQATLSGGAVPGFPYHTQMTVDRVFTFSRILTQTTDWELLLHEQFEPESRRFMLAAFFLRAHATVQLAYSDPLRERTFTLNQNAILGWTRGQGSPYELEIKALTIPTTITVMAAIT
jgi:hypothetical protein